MLTTLIAAAAAAATATSPTSSAPAAPTSRPGEAPAMPAAFTLVLTPADAKTVMQCLAAPAPDRAMLLERLNGQVAPQIEAAQQSPKKTAR